MINVKNRTFNLGRQDGLFINDKRRGYWMRAFFFVVAVLAISPAFAQIIIEGSIKDKETNEGVPFAHVFVEGTSTVTVSDVDGVFVLSVPLEQAEGKLIITSVGYRNFEKTPAEIQASQIKEFLLESAVFELGMAEVRSPEKVLNDALSKLEENYWSEQFMVEGFYRKGALENDKFTFLTEAIIQYYNKGYDKTNKETIDFNFVQLRNSEDFRLIKVIQHWNPIYNALYNYDNIKNRAIFEALKKAKMGTATMEMSVYNDENIYIIKLAKYIIYVGFDNNKIYRVDTKAGKNGTGSSFQYRAYKGKLYPFYFRIKSYTKNGNKIKGHMVTEYKGRNIREETIIEVESAMNEGGGNPEKRAQKIRKQTQKRLVKKSRVIFEATDIDKIGFIQEFVATDIIIKSEDRYKKRTNMDINKDLFETEIFYDLEFWNNFQLPDESKFLQKIKADLEAAGNGKTLDQQFDEVGKKNNESNPKFLKRMKKKK